MKNIYIVAPCRTAVGSFSGSLKNTPAGVLGGIVIEESLKRAGLSPEKVDQVLMGNVLQAAQGQNPARQSAVAAGIPYEVPAMTLNKVCGSGLTAVALAASLIRAGEADCIVAGGTENMSLTPYTIPSMRSGARMGDKPAVDIMVKDGLWDFFNDYHMGITAENVAEKYGITREQQDELAVRSQNRASAAQKSGRFDDEIVPVSIPQRKGDPIIFDKDEYVRHDANIETMGKLRPAFKKDGTVTAANASGINDGAAAMLVVSEEFMKENGLKPIAKYISNGSRGVDPAFMGLGPIPSVKMALEKANLKVEDMSLIEANEAFASQAFAVNKELGFNTDIVNVNGGAIAIGHPIGASGARITVTLLHELKKRDGKYGISTLCIGGGMGEACIFERDELCE